jgi:hypothetical protein
MWAMILQILKLLFDDVLSQSTKKIKSFNQKKKTS